MKIKATVASAFTDYECGWSYAEPALAEMADSVVNVPVFLNKQKVGVVDSGTYEDGKVVIIADVEESEDILKDRMYLVPGGLCDYETNGKIISGCKVQCFALTDQPSDKTLTAYEVIEL